MKDWFMYISLDLHLSRLRWGGGGGGVKDWFMYISLDLHLSRLSFFYSIYYVICGGGHNSHSFLLTEGKGQSFCSNLSRLPEPWRT